MQANIQSCGSEFSSYVHGELEGLEEAWRERGAAAGSAPFPRQVSLLLTPSGYQGQS